MTQATWNLNAERGGVELRFTEKPSAAILDNLKAHGWRWSRFSVCWYTRDTPDARTYAAETVAALAGLPAGQVAEPSAPPVKLPRGGRGATRGRVTRFAPTHEGERGAEVFTNPRGRCEDAPCCGCCS